ncbi:hypothetical protein EZS27_014944 [termite gut metagenome]|uniref:BT4734-like N-terminal domain-containing protein n=1 Tax=termite gut metagenome TaxID=433724 RepID=A0A5J4RUD8_9ZZZZ
MEFNLEKRKQEVKELLKIYDSQDHNGIRVGLDCFDRICRFETKRLAVWTAQPSAGKTTFLNYYSYLLNKKVGGKTLFLSYETFAEEHVGMFRTITGWDDDTIMDNFFFENTDEIMDVKTIGECIEYYRKEAGIINVVIDPFNELEEKDKSTDAIGELLKELKRIAKHNDVILHLVAHPTKPSKQEEKLTRNSTSGSYNFLAKADFLLLMERGTGNIVKIEVAKLRRNFVLGQMYESCDLIMDKDKYHYRKATDLEIATANKEEEKERPFGSNKTPDCGDSLYNLFPKKSETSIKTVHDLIESKKSGVAGKQNSNIPNNIVPESMSNIPTPDNDIPAWITESIKLCAKYKENDKRISPDILNNTEVDLYKLKYVYLTKYKKYDWITEYEKRISLKYGIELGEDCYKQKIDTLRSMPYETKEDKNAITDYKRKNLVMYTVSGLFGKSRLLKNLEHYNNIIAIDVDGDKNPTLSLSDMKQRVNSMPFVFYSAESCSGKGIFALMALAGDKSDFLDYFNALEIDFANVGIIIDSSCKDIPRTRYVSYDINPYVNFDAFVYNTKYPDTPSLSTSNTSKAKKQAPKAPETNISQTDLSQIVVKGKTDTQKLDFIISDIQTNKINIVPQRKDSLQVRLALIKLYGKEGLPYWLKICESKKNYDKDKETKEYEKDLTLEKEYKFDLGSIIYFYRIAKEKVLQNSVGTPQI